MTGMRYPDMLIAFDADPEACRRSNGCIIAEQGKPPDFALEIGSPSTGHVDAGPSATTTRCRAYPSTGASTRRAAVTAPVGAGIVWWTGFTDRWPLRSWRRTSCGSQCGSESGPALETRAADVARPGDGPAHRRLRRSGGPCRGGGGPGQTGARSPSRSRSKGPGTGSTTSTPGFLIGLGRAINSFGLRILDRLQVRYGDCRPCCPRPGCGRCVSRAGCPPGSTVSNRTSSRTIPVRARCPSTNGHGHGSGFPRSD